MSKIIVKSKKEYKVAIFVLMTIQLDINDRSMVWLTVTAVCGVCVAGGALRPSWGRSAAHAQLGRGVQGWAGEAGVQRSRFQPDVGQRGVRGATPGIWNDVWARCGGWERAYSSTITTVGGTKLQQYYESRAATNIGTPICLLRVSWTWTASQQTICSWKWSKWFVTWK